MTMHPVVIVLMASAIAHAAPHFADAGNAALVARGRRVYAQTCSACHGHELQGEPLWQLNDEHAGRRAPALDWTGPAWRHSDEELFHVTAYGRFVSDSSGAPSHMPAFHGSLSRRDILAALAFVKSRWPLGVRVWQASLNPHDAGMPKSAKTSDWTLPPSCTATIFH
jgi:mono/diheme cytochrome c family protein